MTLSLLSCEIVEEITGYLSYVDIISLGMISKDFYFHLSSDDFWREKLRFLPQPIPWDTGDGPLLTPQGMYVKLATSPEKGKLLPGSENFMSIFRCIKRAYDLHDNPLLLYYLKVLYRKRWIYPVTHKKGKGPIERISEDLIAATLEKKEEGLFIRIWPYIKDNIILSPEEKLSYYFYAKSVGLSGFRSKFASFFKDLPDENIKGLLVYCIHAKDKMLFWDIYPYLSASHKGFLHDFTEKFPWPEINLVVKSYRKVYCSGDINMCLPLVRRWYHGFRHINFRSRGDFTRLLEAGNRGKARIRILKGLDDELKKEIDNFYGDRTSYIANSIGNNLITFTVPALTKDKIRHRYI